MMNKIILLTLILIGVIFSDDAQAQLNRNSTPTEQIALAFYKMGNAAPNWDSWIKTRPPYSITPWARREKIYNQEKVRLKRSYQRFNPERHFIIVHTKVKLKPTVVQASSKDEKDAYKLPITFVSAPEASYFPYDFLDSRFILIPYHMQKIMNDDIEKHEYDFLRKLGVTPSKEFIMTAELRADKANIDKPLMIDGLEQWALYTDIVSLSIWNEDGLLLWEYSAPWYVSPNKKKINELYIHRTIPTRAPRVLDLPEFGKSSEVKEPVKE